MSDLRTALTAVVHQDVDVLVEKDREYGGSWKSRGGAGAFFMLARKFDRIEIQAKKHGYDIFAAVAADARPEGLLDDIADLRRYLALVEAHVTEAAAKPYIDLTGQDHPYGYNAEDEA